MMYNLGVKRQASVTVALRLIVTLMLVIRKGKLLAVLRFIKSTTDSAKLSSLKRALSTFQIDLPEVDGHKSQPDNARCVHGEPDVL